MKAIITIIAALVLTGCAGTKFHAISMERHGTIKFFPSDMPDHDYKIMIRNGIDFGMDLDLEDDRKKQVELLFEDQCKKITYINESVINNGTYALTGKPRKIYVMKIKCEAK